jgi:hypothetical protein
MTKKPTKKKAGSKNHTVSAHIFLAPPKKRRKKK